MKALLAEAQKQPALTHELSGRWYKIAMIPCHQSGDRFNIGVVFCADNGTINYRFLAHYERLRCLYGDAIEEQTRFLLQLLREQLVDETMLLNMPSYNLSIDGPFYAAGDCIEKLMDNLYQTIVPIGKPPENQTQKDDSAFQSLNNQKVRGLVYEQLDHLIGIDKTHQFLPDKDYLEIETSKGKRRLDIPLRPIHHYGSIISACYKNPASIEKHLLNAQLDLSAADRLSPKTGKLGLFILRPTESMNLTAKELDAADLILDKLLWKIDEKHWLIEADDSPKRLAEQIATWSES